MMAKKGELTRKQQLFIAEYLVDLNASRAALAAGYSPKTAPWIGQENLRKPTIKAAVEEAHAQKIANAGITAEYVLSSLHEVAEFCKTPRPRYNKDGAIIGEGIDSAGATRSLELLGRHLGTFDTGDGPQKILIDLRLPENQGWTRPYHEDPDAS
jgi:phage terminase small subunit